MVERGEKKMTNHKVHPHGKLISHFDSVTIKELTKRLMTNVCKEGKTSSYFASGWINEIFFHYALNQVTASFNADCTLSEDVRRNPAAHVAAEKSSGIMNAYCTCFAVNAWRNSRSCGLMSPD